MGGFTGVVTTQHEQLACEDCQGGLRECALLYIRYLRVCDVKCLTHLREVMCILEHVLARQHLPYQ
jgi:hypothetical protein